MKAISFYLLYPFSLLYKLITSIRNHLYDIKHFHSFSFQIKTISVGNLTVGGTGKTPHIEYLIDLLKSNYQICTLSRGYGRKTSGIIIADSNSNATTLGDEPMQYYLKYNQEINVAVGEERAFAIPTIIHELPDTNLILLDDAYQHRPVIPGHNILLCDYNKPFFKDYLLPSGRLRESRSGAKRADTILVSKCPESITTQEMEYFKENISFYKKEDTLVLFTGIKYRSPLHFFNVQSDSKTAILVAGVANPQVFEKTMKENYTVIESIIFKDHHQYTDIDIELIRRRYSDQIEKNPIILTTEKDMVKLKDFKEYLENLPVYYIPIEVCFLKENEREAFQQNILRYLNSKVDD